MVVALDSRRIKIIITHPDIRSCVTGYNISSSVINMFIPVPESNCMLPVEEIVEENLCLTEDIEFTVMAINNGELGASTTSAISNVQENPSKCR